MEIENLITELKSLDLSKYPEGEIRSLLAKMGRIGFISTTLHPGHIIVRARPNEEATIFRTREELSYKPGEYNKTFQRASTPHQTMFYGGIVPSGINQNISANARFAPAFEASHLIRNDTDGIQTLTFTKWEVVKDIPLITICHHDDFVGKHAHTFSLNEEYQRSLKLMPQDVADRSMKMTAYLAQEFAKKLAPDDEDYNYMVSSLFTELSLRKTNAGIYYPSVQTLGLGFNVAISPSVVDSSLKLIGASECTIYKKGKSILVDNETSCDIIDDTKPFVLLPMDPKYRFGPEESKKRVGL